MGYSIERKMGEFKESTVRRVPDIPGAFPDQRRELVACCTRHDLMNKVTILFGYLELAKGMTHDPKLLEIMQKQEATVLAIQRHIELSRHYLHPGGNTPEWQDVTRVIYLVSAQMDMGDIQLSVGLPGLEIYADPLFEHVVFNLIDNSLRYGETLTGIRFSCDIRDREIILLYEDDGKGIPGELKELIFKEGYGHHTGYGLYLCRKILTNTGISIRETGQPGSGARFEIAIPAPHARLRDSVDR